MSKQIKQLSDTQIRALKYSPDSPSSNILRDGEGLYIEISRTGAKTWRITFKNPNNNKENIYTIGKYPTISLSAARAEKQTIKELLRKGINPNQHKQKEKTDKQANLSNNFKLVAEEWLVNRQLEDKKDTEVLRRLNHDAYPQIGNQPISLLTTDEIYEKVFAPLLQRGAVQVAKKLKQNLHGIFEFARKNKKLISVNPIADIDLPSPQGTNHAAITEHNNFCKFIKDAWDYINRPAVNPVTAYGLQLSILIFQRPVEIRTLKWENYNKKDHTLLVKQAKSNNPNSIRNQLSIPLPHQAIEILKELYTLTGHTPYILHSSIGAEPYLSEGTINSAIHRLGYKGEQTAHGLRATARTILAEHLEITENYIEAQLGHSVNDTNGQAYNRTIFVTQRKDMLQKWADYIYEQKETIN